METLTHDEQVDLALAKRNAALGYVRKRHALRLLVKLGVFTAEEARAKRIKVVNLRFNWRACRALLRGE